MNGNGDTIMLLESVRPALFNLLVQHIMYCSVKDIFAYEIVFVGFIQYKIVQVQKSSSMFM